MDSESVDGAEIIIDTRTAAEFAVCHYNGAFHFPAENIRSVSCALPQRHCPICVVCSTSDTLVQMEDFFMRMGYVRERSRFVLFVPDDSQYSVATGPPDRSRRCWQPNRLLIDHIDGIESSLAWGGCKAFLAFDVGCGTARDSLFLAQRGGWHCVGFDNRRKLLEQATNLFAYHGEASAAQFLSCQLRNVFPIRLGVVDLVIVSRFLHRPTLPGVFDLPRVGGFLLYSHFLDGCQHTAVGTPSTMDGYLLHNELPELCSSRGDYEVVLNEETRLEDGRPMLHFIAQRRH